MKKIVVKPNELPTPAMQAQIGRFLAQINPTQMQFPVLTRSLFELQGKPSVDVMVVGGQGTFDPTTGNYSTEWPDRGASVEHAISVEKVRLNGGFDLVVPSGGFTQATTPELSEARSFLNMWRKPQAFPNCPVLLDEVALDSGENLIYSLMLVRLVLGSLLHLNIPIARVLFYTQWQFKIKRMNETAKKIGIIQQFYFQAYTDETKAHASLKAKEGEQAQYAKLEESGDFLLLGDLWEKKRFERFQVPKWATAKGQTAQEQLKRHLFQSRTAHLRKAFPETFAALHALKCTRVGELQHLIADKGEVHAADLVAEINREKTAAFQRAFRKEVILPPVPQ